ncbi:MAG: TIM barrel protein [Armatimonadetes bacterium]|nr:TIM barrel protein [Armatimonadota bacterium]
MNLALSTGVFAHLTVDEAAAAVAGAGYEAALLDLEAHGKELRAGDLTAALAARLAGSLDREGLAVAAVSAECDLVNGGDDAQDRLEWLFGLAEPLGTDVVVAGNGPGEDWTAALERLREVLEEAEQHEVALALELAPGMAVSDLDHAEQLLDALDTDCLGLAMDVLAIAAEHDVSPRDVLERIGDVLLVVTVSEVDDRGDIVSPSPRGGSDLGELFDLLGEFAPDAVVVPAGVTPASAAATRTYLARFL